MNDIRKFKPLCKDILLFHDIRPKEVNESIGVYQAIQHSLIDLDEEIVTNESLMGIGIKPTLNFQNISILIDYVKKKTKKRLKML